MKKIKIIHSKMTYSVRQPVLRAEKPIESCQFEGDELESTAHFGLYIETKLIGVVSIFKNNNVAFDVENQFQIRGMAILPEYQRKKYGEELMIQCESYCKNNNGTLIWFNARESATLFYEKLNYHKIGSIFNINDVGLHYLMNKKIR